MSEQDVIALLLMKSNAGPMEGRCTYTSGVLTSISLAHFFLEELPSEIGELEYLEELDLYHNHLTDLPPEIKNSLPAEN